MIRALEAQLSEEKKPEEKKRQFGSYLASIARAPPVTNPARGAGGLALPRYQHKPTPKRCCSGGAAGALLLGVARAQPSSPPASRPLPLAFLAGSHKQRGLPDGSLPTPAARFFPCSQKTWKIHVQKRGGVSLSELFCAKLMLYALMYSF